MVTVRSKSLVPAGLIVESLKAGETSTSVTARSSMMSCPCPSCGVAFRRFIKAYRSSRSSAYGFSRGTVRQIVRGCRSDVFRACQSSLEAYLPLLDALWEGGCRNGAALWRQLQEKGFRGSLRAVGEWSTRRRRAEQASDKQLLRVPSAQTIARLMTIGRDHLTKTDAITIAAIEGGLPTLVEAPQTIDRFHAMIRRKIRDDLTPWHEEARSSLVVSFANGVAKDEAAVRAAITTSWSSGQTEGQVTRLKLVKRQMYGRAKIDLLQARLIGAR